MFGVGFSEIVIIVLLVIVFIKPEDLPRFFRTVGRWYGKAKRAYDEIGKVKDQVLKEIDEAVDLEEKKAAGAKPPEKAALSGKTMLSEKAPLPAAVTPAALSAPPEQAGEAAAGHLTGKRS
jgi:sec-independent protein translocase protein TatB